MSGEIKLYVFSMAEKVSFTRNYYMYYQCAILTKDKEATARN
jgi:hypothetical protein